MPVGMHVEYALLLSAAYMAVFVVGHFIEARTKRRTDQEPVADDADLSGR